jgi:hypothetical protein
MDFRILSDSRLNGCHDQQESFYKAVAGAPGSFILLQYLLEDAAVEDILATTLHVPNHTLNQTLLAELKLLPKSSSSPRVTECFPLYFPKTCLVALSIWCMLSVGISDHHASSGKIQKIGSPPLSFSGSQDVQRNPLLAGFLREERTKEVPQG